MGDKEGEDSLITSRRVTGVRGRCRNGREECVCLQSNTPGPLRAETSMMEMLHMLHICGWSRKASSDLDCSEWRSPSQSDCEVSRSDEHWWPFKGDCKEPTLAKTMGPQLCAPVSSSRSLNQRVACEDLISTEEEIDSYPVLTHLVTVVQRKAPRYK